MNSTADETLYLPNGGDVNRMRDVLGALDQFT
jgi:hypothetical protein